MKLLIKHFASGLLIVLMGSLVFSCKKKATPEPSNTAVTPTFYFIGTLGGNPIAYGENMNGFVDGAFNENDSEPDPNNYNLSNYYFSLGTEWSIMSYSLMGANIKQPFDIAYNTSMTGVNSFDFQLSDSQIDSLFPLGTSKVFSMNYNNSNGDLTTGWLVTMQDAKGVNWSTATTPSSMQTNSYVTLASKSEIIANGSLFLKAKGSLSCMLYDSLGHVQVLKGNFTHLMAPY